MQSTQYITLDLNTRSVFSYVRAKQGDNGSRFVCVTLTENGAAYQLPDGVEAKLRCLKPDGKSIYDPAVINDDGTITVELTEQVLAVPGAVSADICLCDTQGSILSTVSFAVRVDPAPLGNQVASESEFLTLLDIIARSERGEFDGATFTPAVSEGGELSWTNDKGRENPAPVNIAEQVKASLNTENWTFTLEDGSTVTKVVYVGD